MRASSFHNLIGHLANDGIPRVNEHAASSGEFEQRKRQLSILDPSHPHRAARRPPALRRAARVEDRSSPRSARGAADESGRRERRRRPGTSAASAAAGGPSAAPASWTIPIRTPSASRDALRRQLADELGLVDVAVDPDQLRPKGLELDQHRHHGLKSPRWTIRSARAQLLEARRGQGPTPRGAYGCRRRSPAARDYAPGSRPAARNASSGSANTLASETFPSRSPILIPSRCSIVIAVSRVSADAR